MDDDNKLTLNQTDHINEIIKEFDFKKVHQVMTAINWTWVFSGGVPTIRELKKEARRLLKEVAEDGQLHGNFVGCGGFRAFRWYDSLELTFEVSTWASDYLNNGSKFDKAKLTKERQLKIQKIFKN